MKATRIELSMQAGIDHELECIKQENVISIQGMIHMRNTLLEGSIIARIPSGYHPARKQKRILIGTLDHQNVKIIITQNGEIKVDSKSSLTANADYYVNLSFISD